MGFGAVAEVIAELFKLCNLVFSKTNSPEMVKNAMDKVRQNLADQTAQLDQKLSQPNLSPADHAKLIDQLRKEQS